MEGVSHINAHEKIITEDGQKKKVTTIVKDMEDGTKEVLDLKENFDN